MTKHEQYMIEKKKEIMQSLTPKLNAWGITDFDYIYELYDNKEYTKNEWLRIGNTYIGCHSNSVYAVELEALGYLFEKIWCHGHTLGAFDKQSRNVIKRYWRLKNEK